jgi:hypothetical protein
VAIRAAWLIFDVRHKFEDCALMRASIVVRSEMALRIEGSFSAGWHPDGTRVERSAHRGSSRPAAARRVGIASRSTIARGFVVEVVERSVREKPNKALEPTPRLGGIRSLVRRAKLRGNLRGVAHL